MVKIDGGNGDYLVNQSDIDPHKGIDGSNASGLTSVYTLIASIPDLSRTWPGTKSAADLHEALLGAGSYAAYGEVTTQCGPDALSHLEHSEKPAVGGTMAESIIRGIAAQIPKQTDGSAVLKPSDIQLRIDLPPAK